MGVEDEFMLLAPDTFDLVPRGVDVLARCDGDPRFKLELPASQLEIVVGPHERSDEAAAALARARAELAAAAGPVVTPAALALHPFAATEGELNVAERYARIEREYGAVARRQLLCALQVHVAVRGSERALAVHDALRAHLPALVALAAAAPFHGGRDTGFASFRPRVADLLPRHGIPPALGSWERYASELAALPEPGQWWWDVRPHPRFGTLEVRAADAQAGVEEAEAIIALVHALVAWLAARHEAGERLAVPAQHALVADREAAARDGLDAQLGGVPARDALAALLDELDAVAAPIGAQQGLARARALLDGPGTPAEHRAIAADGGPRGLTAALAARFAPTAPG